MALLIQTEQKQKEITFPFAQQLNKPTLVIFYSGKGEAARINVHTDFALYCKKLGLRYFVVSIFNACMNSNHHLMHGRDIKRKLCNEMGVINEAKYRLPQCVVMDKHGLFEPIDFNIACYQHTLFDDSMASHLNDTAFGKCQIDWKPEGKKEKIKRIQLMSYKNTTETIMDKVKIDFGKVVIPQNIQNKPKKEKAVTVAAMYKKKLFDQQYERKNNFGGWLLLSLKNHKICKNNQMLSVSQLGFKFAKSDIVDRVLKDHITIKSCVGTTNSPYKVVMELQNNTGNGISTVLPRAQVFEQNRFRPVQNLAVKEDTKVTVPAHGTAIVEAEALCIDLNHGCCHGEPMNMTPFLRSSALETNVQYEEWNIAAGVEESDLY